MDSSTTSRAPAEQTCPECTKAPLRALSTAASKSASAKITLGFLPPSSRATFFTVPAAAAAITRPVASPPVKETMSTSRCVESAGPTSDPAPVTRFATPSGSPSSCSTSIIKMAVEGVSSAGLRMKEQPAARAGAIFQAACSSG